MGLGAPASSRLHARLLKKSRQEAGAPSKARGRFLGIGGCGLLLLWSLGCSGEEAAGRGADRRADAAADTGHAADAADTADQGGTNTGAAGEPPRCDRQTWRVAVRPGDYLHAVAGQGARDVAVTLGDAAGRPLLRVDSLIPPGAPWPDEEVHWVADAAAELRFDLALTAGPGGPCPFRMAPPWPATAGDRARALAEAALAHGHAARRAGQAASCRAGIAPYESAARGFAGLGLPGRRAEALLGLGLLHKECLRDDAAALAPLTAALPLSLGPAAAPPRPGAADAAHAADAADAADTAGASDTADTADTADAAHASHVSHVSHASNTAESLIRQLLGEARADLGDLDGAIGEYRRALELRRRMGRRADEALTANNLGLALHLRGRYDEAATLLDRAIALGQPGDDPAEWAAAWLNRGHLHRGLGETAPARRSFQAALALFRQAGDRGHEAATLNALGLLELEEDRPGEGLAPLRQALARRAPGSRGRAVTLTSLAVAYRDLGRPADARRAYAEALPIFRRLGDVREQARSLANLGWLEIAAAGETMSRPASPGPSPPGPLSHPHSRPPGRGGTPSLGGCGSLGGGAPSPGGRECGWERGSGGEGPRPSASPSPSPISTRRARCSPPSAMRPAWPGACAAGPRCCAAVATSRRPARRWRRL